MGHSSNQSHFSTVPRADIPRAKFKRDSNLHTTLDAGYLVPMYLDEVLPADTWIMSEAVFGRLATPIKPLMDNLYLDTFWFFCPSRLLWSNWKKMHGERATPASSISYTVPQMVINNVATGTLADYFGLPCLIAQNKSVNTLPFRMYNLVWNEWFRAANLQDSVVVDTDDGPDTYADYTLLKRGKRHDYFTSCLSSPQLGTAISLPLGTSAPVLGIGKYNQTFPSSSVTVYESDNTPTVYANAARMSDLGVNEYAYLEQGATGYPNVRADLSTATAATINDLREAFQTQRLLERDARGGSRYTEMLLAHFGVQSPDARLQRPEYLGGSSNRIGISPVANTSDTATAKQGDLAGVGTVSGMNKSFTFSATEHGYIIGLVSLRADLNYQQGLNRLWTRSDRYDFYYPALAHLGEQAVLNQEIYMTGLAGDTSVFGYNERWSEYKYKPNQITGKFRSVDSGSLDVWHLAQDFSSTPSLNSTFIQESPPMSRVIAVNTEPHMLLDAYFDCDVVRPMPMYSVPGLIDHF